MTIDLSGKPVSDDHALYCGWVAGLAVRNGLDVEPVKDSEGNYTDRLEVHFPTGTITLVIPEPPAGWTL